MEVTTTTQQSTMFATADTNLESFSLIWLDKEVNDTQENIGAQIKLRWLINHLKTFKDKNDCEQYIRSVSEGDRMAFIVSGKLGQEIVPSIHELPQFSSIYIYCRNKQFHEIWAKRFAKIRGVFVQLNKLIEKIKSDQDKQCRSKIHESMSITVFNMTKFEDKSTCEVNGQFIHSQLLLDVFIRMKGTEADKDELVTLCKQYYSNNESQLKIIREFEKDYESEFALWWYTRDSFLYRLLNKALRIINIHLLFLFRFFIRDLREQLQELQCLSPIHLYRSQLMSITELKLLENSIGQLISMNSFLSTTKTRNLALFYLGDQEVPYRNIERVLFEITADPKFAGEKPFADITTRSCFLNAEDEVLIMFGSIFRIINVGHEASGISIVKIELCTNDNKDLTTILEHLKNEYGGGYGETDLICVGQVVRRMGCSSTAEKYFHRCLSSLGHEDVHLSTCYYNLAVVANDKGEYQSSLELHLKALNIRMRILKPDDPDLAESYNGLGNIYRQMRQNAKAHEYYKKALTIWKNVFGNNHQKVAVTYKNIGIVYCQEKNYYQSLEYQRAALSIRQSLLPDNHPELADSHNHIAIVYCRLRRYKLGLEHLNESLRIFQISLPPKHPSIAKAYEDIGYIYERKHDLQNAILNYKQARAIYNEVLPATHKTIKNLDKIILRVELKLKHEPST